MKGKVDYVSCTSVCLFVPQQINTHVLSVEKVIKVSEPVFESQHCPLVVEACN